MGLNPVQGAEATQLKPFSVNGSTVETQKNEQKNETGLKPFQLKNEGIAHNKPNSTNLPNDLKSGIEKISGYSMDDVKVHFNSSKPAQLQALAYAQGTDIHVGPGQEKYLPHEAWHVVQQKQGRVQSTLQMKQGVLVNNDQGLEHAADVMGEKALQQNEGTDTGSLIVNASTTSIVQGQWLSAINFINAKNPDISKFNEDVRSNPLAALYNLAESPSDKHILEQVSGLGNLETVNYTLWNMYVSGDIFSDSSLIEAIKNIYTPESQTEGINDEDHPDLSDAPEYLVDPDEDVYKLDLQKKDPQLMMKIFFNWLNSKRYPIDDTTETKYYQWLYGGVFTRYQFDQLFNPQSGFTTQRVAQLARTPNSESKQASYNTKNFGPFNDVSYMRDNVGNIAFETPNNKPKLWQNPVKPGSKVDLKTDSKNPRFGIMPSGLKVEIAKGSRSQHFAIGDRLLPDNGRGGAWTWHHLSKEYDMVLVDMTVHAKHGHNGGVYLWK